MGYFFINKFIKNCNRIEITIFFQNACFSIFFFVTIVKLNKIDENFPKIINNTCIKFEIQRLLFSENFIWYLQPNLRYKWLNKSHKYSEIIKTRLFKMSAQMNKTLVNLFGAFMCAERHLCTIECWLLLIKYMLYCISLEFKQSSILYMAAF